MSTAVNDDVKVKIMWYFERILDKLSETQMNSILVMLKKFYGQVLRNG